MWNAVKKNEARNVVIVLDTLKKFVNLMDKTEGTKFGKVARQFTQAGGTLIGLAHTNKHRDDEGKSVYSGTTDVADDCDCVYVIDLIDDDRATGKRTIQFRNEKLRGDVAIEKTFTYLRQDGSTYADLLDTLSVVDEETAKHEKELLRKKRQYRADNLVIDTIMDLAKTESLALTELLARVSEETGATQIQVQSHCRAVQRRRTKRVHLFATR
jgi:archaellum biogenesis ATPase FlaH